MWTYFRILANRSRLLRPHERLLLKWSEIETQASLLSKFTQQNPQHVSFTAERKRQVAARQARIFAESGDSVFFELSIIE
jgi:hypothetical protein